MKHRSYLSEPTTLAAVLVIVAAAFSGTSVAATDSGGQAQSLPGNKTPLAGEDFAEIDIDNDLNITQGEAKKASLEVLTHHWGDLDQDGDGVVSQDEFAAYKAVHTSPGSKRVTEFTQVDINGDSKITDQEAQRAGLTQLVGRWSKADKDNNGVLDKEEFKASAASPADRPAASPNEDMRATITVGQGQFKSPETVLLDSRADVYLVSNINGKLAAQDDNGFISRVSPEDNTIIDLKWIDGASADVTLHGPKGMLVHGDLLLVADINTVRVFDRATGEPLKSIEVPGSYMLNDLAIGADGQVYVTDTGGKNGNPPGAVYRLEGEQAPEVVAKGTELNRPDGLITHEAGLLIAPFGANAREVYMLGPEGKKSTFATLPDPQLDGLLRMPDGSILVTSWKGNAIYRLVDGQSSEIATGIRSPAQIGYDEERARLLIPVLQENKLLIRTLAVGE